MSDTATATAAPIEAAPAQEQANAPIEDAQLAPEGTEPPKQEVKPEPPKPTKKQFKTKVNGKEQTLELADDEITQYISKAMAADEKFQEAAMTRKQIEAFVQQLKSNPLEILKHPDLGIDIKTLAEQVLLEELKESEKSPEQKKLEAMEKQLRDYEEKAKALEEENRQKEVQRIKAEQFAQFDNDITAALQGTNLPKSPYVVKRVTDTLIEALSLTDENGKQLYPDVTVKDVMPYVEDLMRGEIEEMFQVMPTEMLEKLIGKSHLNNLRKNRVAQAKTKPVSTSEIKDTGGAPKAVKEEKPKQSFEQIFGRF